MAENKIQLTNFGAVGAPEITYLQIESAVVEIKKTIPFEEILQLIQWAINLTIDNRPFISEPIKIIVRDCAILKFFTNIDFSRLDEENVSATVLYESYDIIFEKEIMEKVKDKINPKQLAFIEETLDKTLLSIVAYRNSAQGIVDVLSENAEKQVTNLENAIKDFEDPKKMGEVHKMMQLVDQLNLGK